MAKAPPIQLPKYVSMYKTTLNHIDKLISDIYKKYADSAGKLNYMALVENNRLIAVKAEILGEIKELNTKVIVFQDKNTKKIYKNSAQAQANRLSKYKNIDVEFVVGKKYTERIVDGKNASMRLAEYSSAYYSELSELISNSMVSGKSYLDIAKEIKDKTNMSLNDSLRIARTEGHFAMNQAKVDVLNEAVDAGLQIKKRWIAAHDDRTRENHAHMDGIEVDIDENFNVNGDYMSAPGLGSDPAENINCRCTFIEVVKGFEPK
jgi:SPP1 gp7 family putative phage head morphogenesis protein